MAIQIPLQERLQNRNHEDFCKVSGTEYYTHQASNSNVMEVKDCFPLEIVEEIIARLPTESLIRFLCMSKEWYSYRSSDKLNSLRSKLAPPDEQLVKILDPIDLKVWNFNDHLETPNTLSFPSDGHVTPAGFSHNCQDRRMILLAIKVVLHMVLAMILYLTITKSFRSLYFLLDRMSVQTRIFSLKANSCNQISNQKICEYIGKMGLFFNGALHWYSGYREIVALDLENEEFYKVPLPGPDIGCMPMQYEEEVRVIDFNRKEESDEGSEEYNEESDEGSNHEESVEGSNKETNKTHEGSDEESEEGCDERYYKV
ncbi:hypothetical protein Tsubulata_039618, partial [Turnera subulata]